MWGDPKEEFKDELTTGAEETPVHEKYEEDIISSTTNDLAQRERRLEEKEQELEKKESLLKRAEDRIAGAKYNLYGRIDVSLSTMNKVVGILAIALVVAVFAGVLSR